MNEYCQPIDISQVCRDYRACWNTIANNGWIFTQPILPRTSTMIVHKQITLQSIRAQITFLSAKCTALRNSYHYPIDNSLVSKDRYLCNQYRRPIDISQISRDYWLSWNTIATDGWIFTQPILPRTSTKIVHKQITLQSIRAQITFQSTRAQITLQSAKCTALRNSCLSHQ